MTRETTSASPAAAPRALASVRRAFGSVCRKIAGFIPGIARRISRDRQRQSAQAECLRQIEALHRRRLDLLVEKEIVAAERREAIRRHRRAASFDARLRAITRELLSIG